MAKNQSPPDNDPVTHGELKAMLKDLMLTPFRNWGLTAALCAGVSAAVVWGWNVYNSKAEDAAHGVATQAQAHDIEIRQELCDKIDGVSRKVDSVDAKVETLIRLHGDKVSMGVMP